MGALQDYSRLQILVDGQYHVQIESLEKVTNAGQQRVDLLNEGLAGFTPGTGDVTIRIGYVIPRQGFELDFDSAAANGDYHTCQIPIADKNYIGTGKFLNNNISQQTNNAVKGTTEWLGELKPLS